MKYLKLLFVTFAILFFSCSDDDLKPISLTDREGTTIRLTYPTNTNSYIFSLVGGDEKYSIKSGDDKIIKAEMASATDFRLTMVAIGETTVTVTDNSQNTLTLNIIVDYYTLGFTVVEHDIQIVGGDLTENEKKAIKEKYLSEIPVKVGGGYEFVYTNMTNGGNAFIYHNAYESYRTETTFTIKELENSQGKKVQAYEVIIDNEKRVFVLQQYYPRRRELGPIDFALVEDITQKVQVEYPKAELVFTAQVVRI